ncbi:MAG: helix-turn-helix domain-containing protein [Pyrinomonadaceae bacterium]|nr:helix-turn-helix domain-containing protein [Pyrinomonadaceae bacterium]
MNYTQLTREQRYQISALMKAGHNQTQIAANLACHKSTISRELRRNRGLKGYRPYQADELAFDRQCEAYRTHCLGDMATGGAALAPGLESGANRRTSKAG